ncbi:hypothetical protein [Sphingopyxis macrogoltabida]|uniref:Terminase n=1 Tax=Sphingopyxis macrogoltabida TaxID=33050 RepID=A0A0N9V0K6_SPHMC|nr:hypothetical protein [Sphingopyxis macrogoltabida]ALH82806.1 hypothetical protein AN936_21305 [Sphingopyxis macrogoltabida]
MQNRTPIAAEARPPLPEFTPVPRKYRHDGWTPERQKAFIGALADTGSVSRAAAMVNMAQTNCYTLRRAPGAESFRRAWEAALDFGVARLKDIAFERAIDGYLVPVFVGEKLMGFRRRYNDALLMFCLRHYGQDAGGKRTVINYFSTRASAGSFETPLRGSAGQTEVGVGDAAAAGAVAEASTTTVRTVIHGGAAGTGDPAAGQDAAAALLDGFGGVALDAQATAEIDAALLALAARQRALIAAVDAGGPDAIAMQLGDPGVELVRMDDKAMPYYGPLQVHEGPADAEPVQRFAGEADWVSAGGDIPDAYLAWIEAAEARGERVPAVPLTPPVADGVAEVKKTPSWRQRRKAAQATDRDPI